METVRGGRLGRLSLALCAGFVFLCQREVSGLILSTLTSQHVPEVGLKLNYPHLLSELQIEGLSLPQGLVRKPRSCRAVRTPLLHNHV